MPPPLISGYSIPRPRLPENGQTWLPVQKPGAGAKSSNFWINGRKCLKFDVLNGILTGERAYACGITGGQAYEFTFPRMGMEARPRQPRRTLLRYPYADSVERAVRGGAGRGGGRDGHGGNRRTPGRTGRLSAGGRPRRVSWLSPRVYPRPHPDSAAPGARRSLRGGERRRGMSASRRGAAAGLRSLRASDGALGGASGYGRRARADAAFPTELPAGANAVRGRARRPASCRRRSRGGHNPAVGARGAVRGGSARAHALRRRGGRRRAGRVHRRSRAADRGTGRADARASADFRRLRGRAVGRGRVGTRARVSDRHSAFLLFGLGRARRVSAGRGGRASADSGTLLRVCARAASVRAAVPARPTARDGLPAACRAGGRRVRRRGRD